LGERPPCREIVRRAQRQRVAVTQNASRSRHSAFWPDTISTLNWMYGRNEGACRAPDGGSIPPATSSGSSGKTSVSTASRSRTTDWLRNRAVGGLCPVEAGGRASNGSRVAWLQLRRPPGQPQLQFEKLRVPVPQPGHRPLSEPLGVPPPLALMPGPMKRLTVTVSSWWTAISGSEPAHDAVAGRPRRTSRRSCPAHWHHRETAQRPSHLLRRVQEESPR